MQCSYVIKIHEQISLHLLPYGELPVFSFLQSGPPWQEQNIVHGMLDLLQLHRCVLHGMSL